MLAVRRHRRRAAPRDELRRDGVDRALVALSTALGIETLPAEEAAALIDAYHRGIDALPARFGAWGAVPLDRRPIAADVDARARPRLLSGSPCPPPRSSTPPRSSASRPLLARLEQRDAPLFVHPGPVGEARDPATAAHLRRSGGPR